MSRIINELVEDCKIYGIETKPKEEIKSLLESWDKKWKKNFVLCH